MASFEIVAHRGIAAEAPENTIASFERAIELGADAVELDVRLTADHVPVVYHYYYLDEATTGHGPIFAHTLAQLLKLRVHCKANPEAADGYISTLSEILERFAGQIGMEIEIKGPEPEAPKIIGAVLRSFEQYWPLMEVTSYEPALLLEMRKLCPGLAADLLLPPSDSWMKLDVVAYQASHRARLAQARAVHLHPTQLSAEVVAFVRQQGLEIHAWDVNDEAGLEAIAAYEIPRICTDYFRQARAYRNRCA